MKVDICIIDSSGVYVYEKFRDMDFIPNIGEGILLDLDDEDGWINQNYYCTHAVCFEKYQVFEGEETKYFVCKFKGEDFALINP